MRSLFLTILLCSSVLAQPPAAKGPAKTPAGKAPVRAASARPSLLNPASLKAKAPDLFKAQFTTSKGDFVVEVHRDWAPNGADRFYNLVKGGFFTDVYFFRVHEKFMVQFGISGNPKVVAAWANSSIPDDPTTQGNKRGNITFAATASPNSRTTQVFINFVDNTFLDTRNFPSFGSVVQGMDVVDQLYSGYGEMPGQGGTGPDPQRIETEGNAYLLKSFPKLDKIISAKILTDAAPAPAEKK
jgi:peptidyl-prolyl cis-trans isomerase A (cyclophilin A)